MKIQELIPYLLMGKTVSQHKVLVKAIEWNHQEVHNSFQQIAQRYKTRTGRELKGFVGLEVFTEIVKFFNLQQNRQDYELLIKEAQLHALHYHNTQFETNDRSKDSQLST